MMTQSILCFQMQLLNNGSYISLAGSRQSADDNKADFKTRFSEASKDNPLSP